MADNTPLSLPYAHLNLRCNPFCKIPPEEEAEVDAFRLDLEYFARQLKSPGFAFQILMEGRPGKTAHLLALRRYFPGAPYLCIDVKNPTQDIPEAPVLFFDQMQCLPKKRRLEVFARPASFGIVSHINHKREFKRANLKFELLALAGLTEEQLQKNIENRINRARRDHIKPVPSVSTEAIARLISMFDDDLVAILAFLYDYFQSMTEVGEIHDFNSNPIR